MRQKNDLILAGHDGIIPGFRGAISIERDSGVVASVLTNCSTGFDALSLADQLVLHAVEDGGLTADSQAWTPGPPCPPNLVGALGTWWSEGEEAVFFWRDNALQGHRIGMDSKFEQLDRYLFRVISGSERGELLTILPDEKGNVVKIMWADYPYLRSPYQLDSRSITRTETAELLS